MDILKMQFALKNTGYFEGICDGINDLKTEIAIRRLQRDFGLISNGIIDDKTEKLLNELIEKYKEWYALSYTE